VELRTRAPVAVARHLVFVAVELVSPPRNLIYLI
jgi:hypothetical protein